MVSRSNEVVKAKMPISIKVASVLFFVHGFIEVIGGVSLIILPADFFAATAFPVEKSIPLALLSLLCGAFRLFIGYAVWLLKKWGVILGVIFSATTIIVAPQFLPFGIMDMLIAMVILTLLVRVWFSKEVLV